MSDRLFPFWAYPAHWGLRGRMLEHAKVDYEISDELERALAHLKIDYDGEDLEHRILDTKLRYEAITQQEYDDAKIDLVEDEHERALLTLKVLRERGEITEREYQRELHTRIDEPWFVFDVNYVSGELMMDADWNPQFVDMLKEIGYKGVDEDEIIQKYIQDMGHKLTDSDYTAEPIELGYRFIKTVQDGENRIYE